VRSHNAISEIAGVLGRTVDLMHVGNNVDRVVGEISFVALIAGVPAITVSLTERLGHRLPCSLLQWQALAVKSTWRRPCLMSPALALRHSVGGPSPGR
jgi:hypothetical protein